MELEQEVIQEMEQEKKKQEDFFDIIRREKGERFLKWVYREIEESGDANIIGFTEKPSGHKDPDSRGKIWVRQTVNGGYSGDSYEGYLYLKMTPEKYIVIYYSM